MINKIIDDFSDAINKKSTSLSKKQIKKLVVKLLNENNNKNIDFLIETLQDIKKINKCNKCNKFSKNKICDFCSYNDKYQTISLFNNYIDLYELGNYTQDGIGSCFMFGDGNKGKLPNLNSLDFEQLKNFIKEKHAKEIILMLDKNVKSEVLSDYIKSFFSNTNIKISNLAVGLSLGSSIEYIDEHTLKTALKNRK